MLLEGGGMMWRLCRGFERCGKAGVSDLCRDAGSLSQDGGSQGSLIATVRSEQANQVTSVHRQLHSSPRFDRNKVQMTRQQRR